MKRPRSPLYPSIGLPEAVSRVQKLSEAVGSEVVSRAEILRGLGFSGANGASLAALSATRKFGLVAKAAGLYKITGLAREILEAPSAVERVAALRTAIRRPSLFAELLGHFGDASLPDDHELRAYLSAHSYSDTAIPQVIAAFRNSIAHLTESEQEGRPIAATLMTSREFSTGQEPFRVLVLRDRIEVTGTLMDGKTIDRLIEALTAVRPLLPIEVE